MLQNLFNCDFSTNATKGFLNFLQSHLNWYKLNSWAFLQCPNFTNLSPESITHQNTNCLNPSTQTKICLKAKLNSSVHILLSRFYLHFIQILYRFYPDFIQILSRIYPDFLETHFILILSRFYPHFIWIKFG